MHLRSEVYPVIPGDPTSEERSHYEISIGGRDRTPSSASAGWFLFSDYFLLREYFRRDRGYWLFLYPWHIGFIMIITFHIFCFFGALASLLGIPVTYGSPSIFGNVIYGLTLATGVVSFISGLFGTIGILIKRLTDKDLRNYATPQNYFTYLLLLAVFLSGLYSWYFDPAFSVYRNFWKGLITFKPIDVEPATASHILLFALLLIYLPFTRSLHYITRLFGFLLIRWDDEPNLRGSVLEKKVEEMLNLRINWNGPHIKPGLTWKELASEAIVQEKKEVKQMSLCKKIEDINRADDPLVEIESTDLMRLPNIPDNSIQGPPPQKIDRGTKTAVRMFPRWLRRHRPASPQEQTGRRGVCKEIPERSRKTVFQRKQLDFSPTSCPLS